MTPDFSRREHQLCERMDQPDCDVQALHRTYARFKTLNAVVSGWRQIYLRELRPILRELRRSAGLAGAKASPLTLLDIGCGGGDVAFSLARWARRDGFQLQVTAIDADARATEYAGNLPADPDIQFRQAMSGDLVQEGQRFDVVISNHLLHHLTAPELAALLGDCEKLCRIVVLHGDIERSPLAYAAFSAVTTVLFPVTVAGTFIREDGLLSIRRSYTVPELTAVAPAGWTVQQQVPFRTLLTHRAVQYGQHD